MLFKVAAWPRANTIFEITSSTGWVFHYLRSPERDVRGKPGPFKDAAA
jgi:hypothetical protein